MIRRGIAIVTYNRDKYLGECIESILDTAPDGCKIVVCDDGSTDNTALRVSKYPVSFVRGQNRGVGANKNRALWSLQDRHFLAIIEDDLFPQEKGWFDLYEQVCQVADIHHFCRVQDKEVEETIPEFTQWMKEQGQITPIYGPSPRGDFTFISSRVVHEVGAFHPHFKGAGYAHGNFSDRVIKAGLVPHPLKWIDIKESRDMFIQKGDREGGRWNEGKKTRQDIAKNKKISTRLSKSGAIYHPLVFP